MSESIKEARKLFLVGITICVVWILTSGALRTTLVTQNIVEDLGIWILIEEAINQGETYDFEEMSIDDVRTGFIELVPVQSGTEVEELRPYVISPPWKLDEKIHFSLTKIVEKNGFGLFEFNSSSSRFNLAKYQVGVFDGEPSTLQSLPNTATSLRDYYNLAFRDGFHGPNNRAAALTYLWSNGWKGQSVRDLRSTDPVVATAMREIQGQSYSISGIPVSSMLYPIAVGAFLALVAFNLLGPVLRVRNEGVNFDREVWIMAIAYPKSSPYLSNIVQLAFLSICVVMATWVTFDLFRTVQFVDPNKQLALTVASVGGIAFALAMVSFAFSLTSAKSRF